MPAKVISVNDNSSRRASQEWLALSQSAVILPSMRKGDFDKFHFGILSVVEAVIHLQAAQTAMIAHDPETAADRNRMAVAEAAHALRLLQEFYAGFTEHTAALTRRPRAARRPRLKPAT